MVQIPRTVTCPYQGFETFSVTYNVWASQEQVDGLIESIGESDDVDRSAVIIDMHGWPEDEYPGGPFSKKAPFLMSIWVCRDGIRQAFVEYVTDPNLKIGS